MAEKWKMPDKEVLNHYISSISEVSKNLSSWEINFIESISYQLDDKGTLSEKQCEILEKIYAEKTK